MPESESLRAKLRRILRLDLALRFVWQSAPGWTLASLGLVVAQGPLPLVSLYLMKLMVDAVTAGLAAADPVGAFATVAPLVVLMGVASLLGAALSSVAGLVSEAQGLAVTDHMQDIIHAKSVAVDLEYYEDPQYHDTLRRAQSEGLYRPVRILNGLVGVAQNSIYLLAMAGLLFAFHWSAALVLFVAVLPGALVRLRHSAAMYRWQRQRTATERRAWYYDWMLVGDAYAKEVRLFGLGALFMQRFRALRRQLRRERLRIVATHSAAELVTQASAALAIYGVVALIAYQALQGAITLGDLVMFYTAFQRGQGYLKGVLGGLVGLYEDSLFLTDLYEFLDLERTVKEPPQPQPVPRPMQAGIVFDHVSFQYPAGTRRALEDVCLTVRPGEKVALVGENGSGKTTLIKLLCRLYDPAHGTITIDGVDLRAFDTTALRREISVIFQDFAHYHLKARENIGFGNVDVPPEDGSIVEAAQRSGADAVIAGLPQGYDTILGRWFEDGEELSVGEWQKVALARAFLRNAQIVVLDEPTSAMDAAAEYEVFAKFRDLTAGQCAILISHRFSTVRMADRIYVLDEGRVVESGTHDELMRLGGTYARLFELQARNYR